MKQLLPTVVDDWQVALDASGIRNELPFGNLEARVQPRPGRSGKQLPSAESWEMA